MLEKFLVLLERFVVAHELIAANSTKTAELVREDLGKAFPGGRNAADDKELPVEGEAVIDTPKKSKAKPAPEPEDDLDDEEPEEVKPKRGRAKKEPKAPDLAELRAEIKSMAKAIAAGESDECADLFDEMLEDFKVTTVNKLADEDVVEFHKEAKALVAKYYEIED